MNKLLVKELSMHIEKLPVRFLEDDKLVEKAISDMERAISSFERASNNMYFPK